jgi:hypothetical protein
MARDRVAPAWRVPGVIAALALLGVLAGCAILGGAAWRAWLGAAFLMMALPVGALALIMMMRLIPGAWARETSPILEAESLLTPLAAVAAIPVLIALPAIYRWTGDHQMTAFRTAWLSPAGFILVTGAWIVILMLLTWRLARRPDAPRAVSCVGLVLYMTVGTFAATDWVQSLDPDFNSSGFALYLIGLQILFGLAVAIVVAQTQPGGVPRQGILGGLLLTVLLFWGYLDFMPFFISWSGNAPSAAVWYLRRGSGIWGDLAWLVAATRFVPAFLLLFRTVRNGRLWLFWVAGVVALGSVPEVAWLVLPAPPGGTAADWAVGILFVVATAAMAAIAGALLQPARAWVAVRP